MNTSTFLQFVAPNPIEADSGSAVREAESCLDRFTQAFNACDVGAMDAELHFPHVMLSGSEQLIWEGPGCHPPDLFNVLRATGWASTVSIEKTPVLAGPDKVHFRVTYERRDATGEVLSKHANLWVVVYKGCRWGISLRSY